MQMLELLVSVLQFVVVMLVPVSFLKLVLSEPVLHQMVVMLVPVSFQKLVLLVPVLQSLCCRYLCCSRWL